MYSYPFYVSNWRNSERVIAMTLEAQAAYRNLLDIAWERGSLPGNDRALQLLAMATDAEWARVREVVLGMFTVADGRLHSELVDEKRPAIVESKAERQHTSGAQRSRVAGGRGRAATAERLPGGQFAKKFTSDAPATDQRDTSDQLPYIRISVEAKNDVVARKPQAVAAFSTTVQKPVEIRQVVNGGTQTANLDITSAVKPWPSGRKRAENAPPELSEWLRAAIALEDVDAANRLWEGCRRLDAEATVEEIARVAVALKPRWNRDGVSNPVGMMLTIVPLEFREGGKRELQRVRETIDNLKRMRS